ncbi:MAG: hypothetical protein JNK45_26160 [Myxococcales bacterium]|nr:hypothetical protein [Myxococcales bacterium]
MHVPCTNVARRRDADRGGAHAWIADEAQALLARLGRIRPLVVQETMTPAAAPSTRTQQAIERSLEHGRARLRRRLVQLLAALDTDEARRMPAATLHQRLVQVRLQFNDVLSNLDLFVDALSQRSERDTGLWLAGLDVVAEDALDLGDAYAPPPVLCYLDRGPGAAIRRARTRLPGGGDNPIALIQIPRERMTGTAVAASLAHETGHQAAALLELLPGLRDHVQRTVPDVPVWQRWLSEIVADLWAVSRLGPTATLGLIGVLSLPEAFVARLSETDPHPPAWLRVQLGAAMGAALYPDAQWAELAGLWRALYPIDRLPRARRGPLVEIAATIPTLVRCLLAHRPAALHGESLGGALVQEAVSPRALRAAIGRPGWSRGLTRSRPSHALAILGQARWRRVITPEQERRAVSRLLATWAVGRALDRPTTIRTAINPAEPELPWS